MLAEDTASDTTGDTNTLSKEDEKEEWTVRRNKYRGCLVGLALGDCIGAAVEAATPSAFPAVTADVFERWTIYPNLHRLKPGQWTDDTSMALCLGHSLTTRGGVDAKHQIELYRDWWKHGKFSSTGKCFDIGNQVKRAITRSDWMRNPLLPVIESAGSVIGSNGGIMRLAPSVLFFGGTPSAKLAKAVVDCSRTTHSTTACLDAALVMGSAICSALEPHSTRATVITGLGRLEPFRTDAGLPPKPHALVASILSGAFRTSDVANGAQVDLTLASALRAVADADTWLDGALAVANRGRDADTVCAVYGQIAGALCGYDALPQSLVRRVVQLPQILQLADALCTPA